MVGSRGASRGFVSCGRRVLSRRVSSLGSRGTSAGTSAAGGVAGAAVHAHAAVVHAVSRRKRASWASVPDAAPSPTSLSGSANFDFSADIERFLRANPGFSTLGRTPKEGTSVPELLVSGLDFFGESAVLSAPSTRLDVLTTMFSDLRHDLQRTCSDHDDLEATVPPVNLCNSSLYLLGRSHEQTHASDDSHESHRLSTPH